MMKDRVSEDNIIQFLVVKGFPEIGREHDIFAQRRDALPTPSKHLL